MRSIARFLLICGSLLFVAAPVSAQTPVPLAQKPWTIAVSAGLTTTSGNKDATTLNVGYELTFDRKLRNSIRSEGLLLRGDTDGELTADRLGVKGRHEFRLPDGGFVFEQLQYVRDKFKDTEYLVAPTSGLGLRLVDTEFTRATLDIGIGGVWERRFSTGLQKSGALTYTQKLTRQLPRSATLIESLSALHKTEDFGDALYTFDASVAAALTSRTQIKVEVLDTYKTRLPAVGFVNNDVTLIVALVYKN